MTELDAKFEKLLHRAEVFADRLRIYEENRYREVADTLPERCKVHVL